MDFTAYGFVAVVWLIMNVDSQPPQYMPFATLEACRAAHNAVEEQWDMQAARSPVGHRNYAVCVWTGENGRP